MALASLLVLVGLREGRAVESTEDSSPGDAEELEIQRVIEVSVAAFLPCLGRTDSFDALYHIEVTIEPDGYVRQQPAVAPTGDLDTDACLLATASQLDFRSHPPHCVQAHAFEFSTLDRVMVALDFVQPSMIIDPVEFSLESRPSEDGAFLDTLEQHQGDLIDCVAEWGTSGRRISAWVSVVLDQSGAVRSWPVVNGVPPTVEACLQRVLATLDYTITLDEAESLRVFVYRLHLHQPPGAERTSLIIQYGYPSSQAPN